MGHLLFFLGLTLGAAALTSLVMLLLTLFARRVQGSDCTGYSRQKRLRNASTYGWREGGLQCT